MPVRCGECGCKRRGKNHNEGKQHINRGEELRYESSESQEKVALPGEASTRSLTPF